MKPIYFRINLPRYSKVLESSGGWVEQTSKSFRNREKIVKVLTKPEYKLVKSFKDKEFTLKTYIISKPQSQARKLGTVNGNEVLIKLIDREDALVTDEVWCKKTKYKRALKDNPRMKNVYIKGR